MNKKYWEQFYASQNTLQGPSLFSQFVFNHYLKPNHSLIELGCGNGRDSIFFASKGLSVLAIDQCEQEISFLSQNNNYPNLEFEYGDFTCLDNTKNFDAVYSRFTMHCIKDAAEKRVIEWVFAHLNPAGKFLIEARGQKNDLYGKGEPVDGEEHAFIYENHFRRFINLDKLTKRLEQAGFNIIFAHEKNGFAPFNDTDQDFIRLIASK